MEAVGLAVGLGMEAPETAGSGWVAAEAEEEAEGWAKAVG